MKMIKIFGLMLGLFAIGVHSSTYAADTPQDIIHSLEEAFRKGDAEKALSLLYFSTPEEQNKLGNQLTTPFFERYKTGWQLEQLASKTNNSYAAVVVRPWVQGKPTGIPDICPMFLILNDEQWLLSPNLEHPFDFRPLIGADNEGQAELEALYEWSKKVRHDQSQNTPNE